MCESSIFYILGITKEKEQTEERRVKIISSTKVPQDLSSPDPIHYKEKGQMSSSPKSEFKWLKEKSHFKTDFAI